MKIEWRKADKSLYLPGRKPEVIQVPEMSYFMLDGKGNPNNPEFSEAIEALYTISYGVRTSHKSGNIPEGYYEYTVYPLEGIWSFEEDARNDKVLNKDKLIYTLMIRQPDFVTKQFFMEIVERTKKKKGNRLLDKVRYERLDEGLNLQMMHIGSYDNELESFKLMEQYCIDNNLERIDKTHKEIYVSDFRKTAPEKLKTVLRFKIKKK